MKCVKLGKTGLQVSRMGLGGIPIQKKYPQGGESTSSGPVPEGGKLY